MEYASDVFNLCELSWPEVADDIKKINKNLYNAIASSLPEKKCTFIKASYPYGAQIIENGVLNLPHKSGISVPITSNKVDQKLAKKLTYSKVPLALLINKANEVHINRNERSIPLELLYPGDLLGLSEIADLLSGIDTQPIWSVSSGIRNLFMLPKISDKKAYRKLSNTLALEILPPHTLTEQWQIFKSISNHKDYSQKWNNDILFFTNNWFEKYPKILHSFNFYHYIFKNSTIKKHYTHTNPDFNLSWNNLLALAEDKNFNSRPDLLNIVKYLLAIAKGISPGFKVADITDIVAPITLLQDVFVNFYKLEKYLPTFMHPHSLIKKVENSPLYYALSLPLTTEEMSSYKTPVKNIIYDICLLKEILNSLKEESVTEDTRSLENIFSNKVQYNYFHNGVGEREKICPINQIPIYDLAFLQDKSRFPDREFCTTAPFFSGCISITVE